MKQAFFLLIRATSSPVRTYLTLVSLGGIFVVVSNCYSNVIRAEGQAGKAMIVDAFLTDQTAFEYGMQFSHILLSTSFLFGLFYVLCNALQAMGAATAALIVNLSRQGIIYIPAVFITQTLLGITGLVWAQPVADVLSLVLVAVLYLFTMRRMKTNMKPVTD